MVVWQKTMYKCSLRRLPTGSLPHSRKPLGHYTYESEQANEEIPEKQYMHRFMELAKAIERDDEVMIEKAVSLAPEQVEFTDAATGASLLHIAARFNGKYVQKLLRAETVATYLNETDSRGMTPILTATWYGNIGALRTLLRNGAHLMDSSTKNNRTALHIAAAHEDKTVIEEILRHRHDPDFLNATDENGDTALMIATELNTPALHVLLKAGADHRVKNPITGRNVVHLAVLFEHQDLIKMYIDRFPQPDFLITSDKNGDTPLMMAIKVSDSFAAHALLNHINAVELVQHYHNIVHDLISMSDPELLKRVLYFLEASFVSNWTNSSGNTALMTAIDKQMTEAIDLLLWRKVHLTAQKDNKGFTVVHKAVWSGNLDIIKAVLNARNILEVINIPDADGTTPYEMILMTPDLECFNAFRESGHVSDENVNDYGDSALFVATEANNVAVVLYLLLSDRCREFLSSTDLSSLTEVVIKKVYYRGYISASDVYILTGRVVAESLHVKNPNQDHLFKLNNTQGHIFHACAKGGDVSCLIFIYNYCSLFRPKELDNLDKPDIQGTTPLLLACLAEQTDIITFLIIKRANICQVNNFGFFPLGTFATHITSYRDLINTIFNNCIISDRGALKQKTGKDINRLTINLDLFFPKGMKRMKVITSFFDVIPQPDDFKVLSHPLLVFFVWLIWSKIGRSFDHRLKIAQLNTALFTTYLILKYCHTFYSRTLLVTFFRWLSFASCLANFLINLPLALVYTNFSDFALTKLIVVAPTLGMVTLVSFNGNDRTSLEMAGLTVLSTWFSWVTLHGHGVSSRYSDQMAMFHVVLTSIIRYVPIFLLAMFSFSFYFFTLFHNYFVCNNPLHAFIFTAFQLPEGCISLIPAMNNRMLPLLPNQTHFKTTEYTSTGDHIMWRSELRGMLIEGSILILYLTFVTSLLNMLTALAIRGAEDVELGGQIVLLSIKIRKMNVCSHLLETRVFKFLEKLNLLHFFLIPPTLREDLKLPLEVHPLVDQVDGFDLFHFKRFVTEKENLITSRSVPFLLQRVADQSFGPEIKYSTISTKFNQMFLHLSHANKWSTK